MLEKSLISLTQKIKGAEYNTTWEKLVNVNSSHMNDKDIEHKIMWHGQCKLVRRIRLLNAKISVDTTKLCGYVRYAYLV